MGSLFSPIRSRREASFLPYFPSLAHMDGPHARLKSNHSKVLLLEPPFCVAGETTWEKMCNQVLWLSSSLHLPALTLHPQPTHLPSPILLISVLAASYASTKIQKAPELQVLGPASPPALQTFPMAGPPRASVFLLPNGMIVLCLGRAGL